jgi:hypothetical protein
MAKRAKADETTKPAERLAAVRDERATLRERRDQITVAAVPPDVAIARAQGIVDAHVAGYRERMAPIWVTAVRPDFDAARIDRAHFLGANLAGTVQQDQGRLAELVAVTAPDTFKSLMAETIRAAYAASEGMPAAERVAAIAELDAAIAALELEEERLVRELEDVGHPVVRRSDADPALVVAASLETHPRATAR